MYFLERPSELEMAIGEAEVTAVAWIGVRELEEKLRARDADIVPRAPVYVDAFFAHVRKKFALPRGQG